MMLYRERCAGESLVRPHIDNDFICCSVNLFYLILGPLSIR